MMQSIRLPSIWLRGDGGGLSDAVYQAIVGVLVVVMVLDMTVPPSRPTEQLDSVAANANDNVAAQTTVTSPVAAALAFRRERLTPYLEALTAHVLTSCNVSAEMVHIHSDRLQELLRSKQHIEAVKGPTKGAARGGGRAAIDGLPWWASTRYVDTQRDHRSADFATMTGEVDGFMSRYLSPERTDGIAENITFATNTVDKLVYQLDNFEPLHHRFSNPQWNGISLQAQRRLGAKCPRAFIIGISSVNRQTNYLVSTLVSMMAALDEEEKHMIHIVIFNGNYPADRHEDIASVRLQFPEEMSSGLIEIVELSAPHKELHDSARLARRWGDTPDRVLWRSKQVLDVASLMQYCSEHVNAAKGHGGMNDAYQYFLMMEDDIISSKHFVRRLRAWVDSHVIKKTDWTMLSFYNPWPVQDMEQLPPNKFYGVIGQLFRLHDLPVVVEFLKKNFDQSPLDWLFVDFLKKMGGSITVHTPSLFQHQGTVSSLDGKRQSGESVDFVAQENP